MTLSPFAPAWLAGEARALALLPDDFRRQESRAHAVEAAAARSAPPALLQSLSEGHANHAPSDARQRNLDLLSKPGTVTVVSGQQVGLFLGPLYTLYKAAAAVVNARALSSETGRPCVPVFWLQTEDNDLPEVDHCFLPRSNAEPLRLSLAIPEAAAFRQPVSEALLGPSVVTALDDLRAELAAEPHFDEHFALLTRAYRPETTLPQAFAQVIATLFADEGLLVLNPRHPRLGALAAPIHRRAITEAAAISAALTQRTHALSDAGFATQVHIRPGSPLSFYAPDGENGARYRLDPTGTPDTWKLVGHPSGATVTTRDLLGWLEKEPRRFTTSALLRPVLQDSVLPNAAYVGGPGELAYLAQVPPLHKHFGLPLSMAVHRARFRIVDGRTRNLLERLKITADEAVSPRDALLSRLGASTVDSADVTQQRLLDLVLPEVKRLGTEMVASDATLSRAVGRTEENLREILGKYAAKHARALMQKDTVTVDRLDRVRATLLPNGEPQERVFGLSAFASTLGQRALVELVLRHCEPFSSTLKDLLP